MITIIGLGNPGEEYHHTRHNVGRMIVESFHAKYDFPAWKKDASRNALISRGSVDGKKVQLLLPETYMNASGKSVKDFAGKAKQIQDMIVVHDDLDLPLGSFKISFDRNAAGHNGVISIIKHVKSTAFTRVRIGIVPKTPKGTLKKPKSKEKALDFIIGPLKKDEQQTLTDITKELCGALTSLVTEGRDVAMQTYNTKK